MTSSTGSTCPLSLKTEKFSSRLGEGSWFLQGMVTLLQKLSSTTTFLLLNHKAKSKSYRWTTRNSKKRVPTNTLLAKRQLTSFYWREEERRTRSLTSLATGTNLRLLHLLQLYQTPTRWSCSISPRTICSTSFWTEWVSSFVYMSYARSWWPEMNPSWARMSPRRLATSLSSEAFSIMIVVSYSSISIQSMLTQFAILEHIWIKCKSMTMDA